MVECLENKNKFIENKSFKLQQEKRSYYGFSIKTNNINLEVGKSVNFLGIIVDYKLMFEEHIKSKIHNSKHVTSSFYSLKNHQYKIPDKTLISLYKIFIRSNFHYGKAELITGEIINGEKFK